MAITDTKFMQGYIRLTDDAAKKGWHEKNGALCPLRVVFLIVGDTDFRLYFQLERRPSCASVIQF